MLSYNYLLNKEIWKQKIFRKTSKILFFVVFHTCFLGKNVVFYRPIMVQMKIAVI